MSTCLYVTVPYGNAIRKLLLEAELVDSMAHYELLEDDPGGYRFTQGWGLGLERAVEMLRGRSRWTATRSWTSAPRV